MKEKIKCDWCGKEFWRTKARIRKNKHNNFCSNPCKFAWIRNSKTQDEYDMSMGRKIKSLSKARKEKLLGQSKTI